MIKSNFIYEIFSQLYVKTYPTVDLNVDFDTSKVIT